MQSCKVGKLMVAGLALGVGLPVFTWAIAGRVVGQEPAAINAADGQPPDRGRNNRQRHTQLIE